MLKLVGTELEFSHFCMSFEEDLQLDRYVSLLHFSSR